MQKLPYQLILGDQEKAAGKVAVRNRAGADLGQIDVGAFIERIRDEARPGAQG